MAKPIVESRINKAVKKITGDFFVNKETGVIEFMTEESTEKVNLAEALSFFDNSFCTLTISNENKSDSLEIEPTED